MVCKVNRYSITNHLVSIVNISIDEFEVIRESLYSCNLTHRHAAIQMLLPRNKALQILLHFFHLGCLRVELTLTSRCLYSEAWLIPASNSIP